MITLKDLSGLAITFVVVAIVLGIGSDVLTSMRTNQLSTAPNSSYVGWNATTYGLSSLQTLSSWLPTIAIIIAASVIIGIITAYFYTQQG